MPTYSFACTCGKRYEEFRWFSEGMPGKCPACPRKYGKGFGQDYSQNRPLGLAYGNPTTVGQQSEINMKKTGTELEHKLAVKEKKKRAGFAGKLPQGAKVQERPEKSPPPPWWRDGSVAGTQRLDAPLNLKEVKNLEKYVQTGDKQ
jgi:putative FmdB family regulatory protein